MKKSLLYLSILAAIVAVIFYLNREDEIKKEVKDHQEFATKDTEAISRIFIANKTGEKVDLTKTADGWVVNGKYKVMPYKIRELIGTVGSLEIQRPVSKAQWDYAVKMLATKSKKVEIYQNGKSAPFKVYHVGGHTVDGTGTYMIMEEEGQVAERPYIISIPGFEGVLDVRYYTEEESWRHSGIFDFKLSEIAKVEINYTKYPQNSFVINVLDEDSFQVIPTTPELKINELPHQEGLVHYLSSFEYLNAESFQNQNPVKDSILSTTPFLKMSITDKNGTKNGMTVYYMPMNKRSKSRVDIFGDDVPHDLDHYYALINDGQDFVTIQTYVFGRIFKKYRDFFLFRG